MATKTSVEICGSLTHVVQTRHGQCITILATQTGRLGLIVEAKREQPSPIIETRVVLGGRGGRDTAVKVLARALLAKVAVPGTPVNKVVLGLGFPKEANLELVCKELMDELVLKATH